METRRNTWPSLLLVSLSPPLLVLSFLTSAFAADNARPNVLFILVDDLRAELGCYGSPLAQTPNIDELAAAGLKFDRAYCQFPLCNPSRSSMLTGRQPATTGIFGNRSWFGREHPEFVSLPRYFREHGYATLRTGKIFHGGIDDTESWTAGGEDRVWGASVPRDPRRVAAKYVQQEERKTEDF